MLFRSVDGAVVAGGIAGLNTSTTEEGAAWAFVTVDSRRRRQGIGAAVGANLLEHLQGLGATKATSFFRATDEGERWAVARGWSRPVSSVGGQPGRERISDACVASGVSG